MVASTLGEESYEEVWQETKKAVDAAIDKIGSLNPEEKALLEDLKRQLTELREKLHHNRVEIVVFGEISTGKSALINALVGEAVASVNVCGGWTPKVSHAVWKEYRVPGLAGSSVVLVDTPGINEIDGAERARLAKKAAELSDVILFVTDSDLNELEYDALLQLVGHKKPLILVVNKADLFTREQQHSLLEVVRQRVRGLIPEERVIMAAADPREREYIIQRPDGTEDIQWRKPQPDVQQLKLAIFQILDQQGLALVAANATLFAKDASDAIVRVCLECRDRKANELILQFAAMKGVVVAGLPVILLDVGSGVLIDIMLIQVLANVFGMNMGRDQAKSLVTALAGSAGLVGATDVLIHTVFGALKTLTGGWATPLTLIPQAIAAAFSSYIIGQAAKYFFQNGGTWGNDDPRAIVKRILKSTDKTSIKRQLEALIRERLLARPKLSSKPI